MLPNSKAVTLYSSILCLAAFFLICSCASKVSPDGGAKDIKPPQLVKAMPENYSLNFNAKEITIAFDEFIQLKDLETQLVVSPLLKPVPTIVTKKKSLYIKFNSGLLSNTTYTLNFGQSILDLHEGNVLENFQYVFSTGNFLDSLSVKGQVADALSQSPVKGVLVMLYKSNDDSLPLKSPPDYFAKTDQSGNFIIKNIASGSYKIFALADGDANYLFNSPSEKIAFIETPVIPGDSLPVKLKLFAEEPQNLFIKKSYFENKAKAVVIFNKPANKIFLEPIAENSRLPFAFKEYSLNHDTLIIWMEDTLTDTLRFVIRSDTSYINLDTVEISRNTESKFLKGANSMKLAVYTNAANLKPGEKIFLYFSQPVNTSKIKPEFIKLFADSIAQENFTVSLTDTLFYRNAKIDFDIAEKRKTALLILPGAFTSIYGTVNDTVNATVSVRELNAMGSLTVKIKNLQHTGYILQLLNDKGDPAEEQIITASGNYLFSNLTPMKYRLRLIADANGNKKWDTGNYLKKIQPEKVYYYPDELIIRANWDLEQEWVLK